MSATLPIGWGDRQSKLNEADLMFVDRRGYVGGQTKEVSDDELDKQRSEDMRELYEKKLGDSVLFTPVEGIPVGWKARLNADPMQSKVANEASVTSLSANKFARLAVVTPAGSSDDHSAHQDNKRSKSTHAPLPTFPTYPVGKIDHATYSWAIAIMKGEVDAASSRSMEINAQIMELEKEKKTVLEDWQSKAQALAAMEARCPTE